MTKHLLAATVPVALCALLLNAAFAADPGTFHFISHLHGYSQPGGLVEGSPGLFYSGAQLAGTGSPAIYSVTIKGLTTTLTSFPSAYNLTSFPVGGPNGRLYDAVVYMANPGNVFSVDAIPGIQQYPPQAIVPSLAQSLPAGRFFGRGSNLATGSYLVTCDQGGIVTPFYQFPSTDNPFGPPIYASDGNYYGVDWGAAGPYLYRVTPSGSLTNVHSFPDNFFRGLGPAPLLQGSDGNLYGAAPRGGANGTGAIYKLSLAGQYAEVYTFPKTPAGFTTWLMQASDGNLYGTTAGDTQAPNGHSVLYRVTTSGQYTQLYSWSYSVCNCELTQGSDGVIYGVSQFGGGFFAWDGGLAKPAPSAPQFTPQAGPAGTKVLIWGDNLLSAKVLNSGPNYVWATVPTGAVTGPITVTAPGGSYTTAASFTVQ